MELGVRDWMIIVGLLLIFAVLLDGYRRVRNERRGKIRVSLNRKFLDCEEDQELPNSELPGEPRVVGRRVLVEENEPELDLDRSAPILMESVEPDEPLVASRDADLDPEPVETEPLEPLAEESEATDSSILFEGYGQPTEEPEPETVAVPVEDQEVIAISVMARNGARFKGPDLLQILLACDVRFGEMQFFHRYENNSGKGAVQFSVANILNPGTFDIDDIEDFETPGVSFFMRVPGPENPLKAFDFMVETAQCLVKNLDGELLDETRSAMTKQTLEHSRQRIIDIERRRLTQHA
jgi:cell division protein ZipA